MNDEIDARLTIAPFRRFEHVRDDMLAAQKHAFQIDVHQPVPLLDGHLGDVLDEVNPGVVYQNIDTAKRRDRLTREPSRNVLVRHAADDAAHTFVRQRPHEFVQPLRVDVIQYEARTFTSKEDCCRTADTAGCAGYNRNFFFQSHGGL